MDIIKKRKKNVQEQELNSKNKKRDILYTISFKLHTTFKLLIIKYY